MPPLQVNLTPSLRATAEARAAESGRSLDDYLSALIRADAEAEVDPEVEAQLLERLDSGEATELPPKFWDELLQRAQDANLRTPGLKISARSQ